MARRILEANPFREQGVRSAFGLMRMGEKHGSERTERACAHALSSACGGVSPVRTESIPYGLPSMPLPRCGVDADVCCALGAHGGRCAMVMFRTPFVSRAADT